MVKTTVRLTVFIDHKKANFEKLAALDDVNAYQKVRQMIEEYIEEKSGGSLQGDVFK